MPPFARKIFFIVVSLILLIAFVMTVVRNFNYFDSGKITQDRYFKDYKTFMEGVQSRYHTFDNKTWAEHDAQFYDFAYVMRKDFDTTLTFNESIELQQMAIMYHLYRYKHIVNKHINTQYRADANYLATNLNELIDTIKSVHSNTYTGGAINLIRNGVDVHAKPYAFQQKPNTTASPNVSFTNEQLMELLYKQLKQNADKKDTQVVIVKKPAQSPSTTTNAPTVEGLIKSTVDTLKKKYVVPFIIEQLQK